MECKEVRKNLKDYASETIKDSNLKAAMEKHINTCYICKKELSMWDDVLDKQKSIKNLNNNLLSVGFRNRVKKRMKPFDKYPGLQPVIMAVLFRTFASIIFISLLVYAIIKSNILSAALILLSMLSFFLLSMKKK